MPFPSPTPEIQDTKLDEGAPLKLSESRPTMYSGKENYFHMESLLGKFVRVVIPVTRSRLLSKFQAEGFVITKVMENNIFQPLRPILPPITEDKRKSNRIPGPIMVPGGSINIVKLTYSRDTISRRPQSRKVARFPESQGDGLYRGHRCGV